MWYKFQNRITKVDGGDKKMSAEDCERYRAEHGLRDDAELPADFFGAPPAHFYNEVVCPRVPVKRSVPILCPKCGSVQSMHDKDHRTGNDYAGEELMCFKCGFKFKAKVSITYEPI